MQIVTEDEKVCAALNDLAWWDMPLTWIRDNNALFLQDLSSDEERALASIAMLAESRKELEAKVGKIS